MPSPYDHIPEDVLKEAAADSAEKKASKTKGDPAKSSSGKGGSEKDSTKPNPALKSSRQRRIIKKRRAGVVLSREEVKEIKKGRRKLRREMRGRGIKSKREFELVAGSLGLYFDKNRGCLVWLLSHWLAALLAMLLLLILILFIFSIVTQLRGHFTINLSDDMFREGFVLSDSVGFENPTVELFASPAENVPCVSIKIIPTNVDEIDGEHNEEYFAYTYYIRNEGKSTVDYVWELELNSESKELSDAAWVMLFEDGKMRFYAEANNTTGEAEALPAKDDNTRGYLNLPIMELAPDSDQFEVVRTTEGGLTYYRVIPDKFESQYIITHGEQLSVAPGDVHKYTVVLWLEGDDVDADNSKIGGHLGTQMNFRLKAERKGDTSGGFRSRWEEFWENLRFWD